MTDVNGLGSFSSITSLKEIAENKDMPVLLKVSMFLNQLGIEKQAEAKTLIKDLDDTRQKASDYGNIANSFNDKKEYFKESGGIYLPPESPNASREREIEAYKKAMDLISKIEDLENEKSKEYDDNIKEGLEEDIATYSSLFKQTMEDIGVDAYIDGDKVVYKEYNKSFNFSDFSENMKIRNDLLGLGPEIYGNVLPEKLTIDKVNGLIDKLKSQRETLMSTVQEKMVVIQDVMGQYNTFVQGSSSTLGKYADMAKSLSRNML